MPCFDATLFQLYNLGMNSVMCYQIPYNEWGNYFPRNWECCQKMILSFLSSVETGWKTYILPKVMPPSIDSLLLKIDRYRGYKARPLYFYVKQLWCPFQLQRSPLNEWRLSLGVYYNSNSLDQSSSLPFSFPVLIPRMLQIISIISIYFQWNPKCHILECLIWGSPHSILFLCRLRNKVGAADHKEIE